MSNKKWTLIKGMVDQEHDQVQETDETEDIFIQFRKRILSDHSSNNEVEVSSKTGYVSSNDSHIPGYHLNSDGSVPKSPYVPPTLNKKEK